MLRFPSRCEISPKESRGRILSIVQLFISCGIAIGFFICYGSVNIHSSLSWRLPFILQTAISVVIAIGCVFLPFSPRWLMHKGRTEEADRVLDYLDKRMAEAEKEEIKAAQEEASTKDFKVQELWEQRVRKRTFLTVFMQGARRPCEVREDRPGAESDWIFPNSRTATCWH